MTEIAEQPLNPGQTYVWHDTLKNYVIESECGHDERQRDEWAPYYYEQQLRIARLTRCALIAVQAELYHLRFKAKDKMAPIALSNYTLNKLGFNHHDKKRALKGLERSGVIRVEWRRGKSPLVTILAFGSQVPGC